MPHPIDKVVWLPTDRVRPNDYNPNYQLDEAHSLLRESIEATGWTQPIVVRPPDPEGVHVIVDGEHRWRVGCELGPEVPCVILQADQAGCIAATVRHNRARGSHGVDSMLALVKSLRAEGLDDAAIEEALGMSRMERERLELSEDAFLSLMAGTDQAMGA